MIYKSKIKVNKNFCPITHLNDFMTLIKDKYKFLNINIIFSSTVLYLIFDCHYNLMQYY